MGRRWNEVKDIAAHTGLALGKSAKFVTNNAVKPVYETVARPMLAAVAAGTAAAVPINFVTKRGITPALDKANDITLEALTRIHALPGGSVLSKPFDFAYNAVTDDTTAALATLGAGVLAWGAVASPFIFSGRDPQVLQDLQQVGKYVAPEDAKLRTKAAAALKSLPGLPIRTAASASRWLVNNLPTRDRLFASADPEKNFSKRAATYALAGVAAIGIGHGAISTSLPSEGELGYVVSGQPFIDVAAHLGEDVVTLARTGNLPDHYNAVPLRSRAPAVAVPYTGSVDIGSLGDIVVNQRLEPRMGPQTISRRLDLIEPYKEIIAAAAAKDQRIDEAFLAGLLMYESNGNIIQLPYHDGSEVGIAGLTFQTGNDLGLETLSEAELDVIIGDGPYGDFSYKDKMDIAMISMPPDSLAQVEQRTNPAYAIPAAVSKLSWCADRFPSERGEALERYVSGCYRSLDMDVGSEDMRTRFEAIQEMADAYRARHMN